MTFLLLDDSGSFRKKNEGVFDENGKCIHVCPSPKHVDNLMANLFKWLNDNKNNIHPLILSSIFHYEFVFIHPFSDGNGRMARLWQNSLLYFWKDIFLYIPLESEIYKYQDKYYEVIDKCNKKGDGTMFITFMLKMIDNILKETLKINAN